MYELVQVVKEMMAISMEMEALKKTTKASKVQMEAQATENHALKLQLQAQDQYLVELEKCQEKLKLTKSKSYQLRKELQMQRQKFEEHARIMPQMVDACPPSPSTNLPLGSSIAYPLEPIVEL